MFLWHLETSTRRLLYRHWHFLSIQISQKFLMVWLKIHQSNCGNFGLLPGWAWICLDFCDFKHDYIKEVYRSDVCFACRGPRTSDFHGPWYITRLASRSYIKVKCHLSEGYNDGLVRWHCETILYICDDDQKSSDLHKQDCLTHCCPLVPYHHKSFSSLVAWPIVKNLSPLSKTIIIYQCWFILNDIIHINMKSFQNFLSYISYFSYNIMTF